MIGTAALVGLFPFAGFWSKDEIIASAYYNASDNPEGSPPGSWWSLSIGGAFVTAFYMARAVSLTFFGKYKGQAEPHESPAIMTVPADRAGRLRGRHRRDGQHPRRHRSSPTG